MGIAERREAEREALKRKIFDAASEIILNDGYEKLSLRKIARKIEYSPAVLYNYFTDKAEIVSCIINENYNRIVSALKEIELDKMKPDIALRTGLTAFLWLMIENPQQYRAVMLSGIDVTGSSSSVLNGKNKHDGEAIGMLVATIETGKNTGIFREIDGELGAMLLVTAAFGLVARIVTDNITDNKRLELLIGSYVDILVNGMLKEPVG